MALGPFAPAHGFTVSASVLLEFGLNLGTLKSHPRWPALQREWRRGRGDEHVPMGQHTLPIQSLSEDGGPQVPPEQRLPLHPWGGRSGAACQTLDWPLKKHFGSEATEKTMFTTFVLP